MATRELVVHKARARRHPCDTLRPLRYGSRARSRRQLDALSPSVEHEGRGPSHLAGSLPAALRSSPWAFWESRIGRGDTLILALNGWGVGTAERTLRMRREESSISLIWKAGGRARGREGGRYKVRAESARVFPPRPTSFREVHVFSSRIQLAS